MQSLMIAVKRTRAVLFSCNSDAKYGAWYVNGEQCSFGIWEDDVLKIPIPYVITDENWCSFLKKYEWKTDCRLYYNVKQNKTFDEVITEKLVGMSHSDERLQYYTLLACNADSLSVQLLTGKLTARFGFALSLADVLRKCSLKIFRSGSGKENMVGSRLGIFISFQSKINIIFSCGFQKIPDIFV